MLPDPRDWYSTPFGYSQDKLDIGVIDDGAMPPDQEPTTQPGQPTGAPMTTEDLSEPAPAVTNAPGQADLLAFPDKSPL